MIDTLQSADYQKLAEKYHGRAKAASVFGWIFIGLACVAAIGLIVCLILLGIGEWDETFLVILCFCFAGVAALFGMTGALVVKELEKIEKKETDCLELADSGDSFFVGDGTLAVFGEQFLRLEGTAAGKKKTVSVPNGRLRFFSVCVRHAPREKGEWSVVIEIPAHYLAKKGKAKEDDPPVLVQTDAKPRLYECLKKYNLPLIGETPAEKGERGQKFNCLKKFVLADSKARKKYLFFLLAGAVLAAGGFAAAFLWNTAGSIIAVVGMYLLIHGGIGYVRAKSEFRAYREGIFWKDKVFTENVFLKWEEIGEIRKSEKDGLPSLRVECPYGAYEFSEAAGAYDYLKEHFAEKCRFPEQD